MTMTLLIPVLLLLAILSRAHPSGPPILSKPLTSQLVPTNPAVSSAFLIPATSALLANVSSPLPALRVPPSWSFSIGFSGATFLPPSGSSQKLSFSSQLDNGDPLPDWLRFAQDTITFGGVAPKESHGIQVLKIVVTASTKSGMTASDAFTLIVCAHDLSLTGPLLTRNVTANNSFSIVLNDWQGVQVDGAPPYSSALAPTLGGEVNPNWISSSDSANLSLNLDTSSFPWLKYDAGSCTLSGTPPGSLAGVPVPIIPAFVKLTLAQTTQYLTVSTNLTLVVSPSLFSAPSLPALSAPPGTKIAFALASFLTIPAPPASTTHKRAELAVGPISNVNVSAAWDPQNATWLSFDETGLMLRGTVPQNAPDKVQVVFTAMDEIKGSISRTQMRIDVEGGGGDGNGRGVLPTDTLRRTGKKIQLAVGVVFGIAAGVILLACLLAICRHCCVAREHVDGAYVIDQSGCDRSVPYKSSLEKEDYQRPEEIGIGAECLGPFSDSQTPVSPNLGRTMTKAAFFDAMRTRFGGEDSWRPGRNAGKKMVASSNDSGNVNGSDHTGISFFGSGKRPRKSKISKPMVMLSSSTSVRDGFAERGGDAIGSLVKGKGKPTTSTNFTIFGDGNNAGTIRDGDDLHVGVADNNTHSGDANIPPTRPAHADISHVIGRVFMSSPGAAALAYDRSRSISDPVRNSIHGSVGTAGSPGKRQSGSASAPSLGTGTHSGTQSTFATGDSTRLTNAAGEVPFRRPGFDGRWETLGERNLREAGTMFTERSTGNVGAERSIGSPLANHTPDPFFPPRALVKGSGNITPASSAHSAASRSNTPPGSDPAPPKSAILSKPPTPSKSTTSITTNTSLKSSKASTPSKSVRSKTASNKSSPLNPATSSSAGTPSQSATSTRSGPASKLGSDRSLGAPSSYRKMFLGDKGNESDSSVEDVDNAIIKHVVNRSSNDIPIIVDNIKGASKPGKPRLVAFTHERTTAASGQGPRRDVSQKAVVQGGEDSDPEAEMRIGLEYVRRLGDPDTGHETSYAITGVNTMPSTTVSFTVDPTRTPSAEYYASNDSNHSIAGRTRVLAPLVISSHRNRHHVAQSMASTHDSFVSLAEREGELPRESRWMVEAALPQFTFSAKEPFNFAVPLDREHKHASALAGSALEAKQADGRPLPEWLRFDKGGKEFWGVTPNAAHGEGGELMVTRVVVKIWDGEKSEVVGGCIVDVFGEKE